MQTQFIQQFNLKKSGESLRGKCPKCGSKDAFVMAASKENHPWNCKSCGEKGNIFTLGYKDNNIKKLTDIEFLVNSYRKTSEKPHRLSDKVIKHFGIKEAEYLTRNGKLIKNLSLFDNDGKKLKRLIGKKWINIKTEEKESDERWLNKENAVKNDVVYICAGEWDLFALYENTGIDGTSYLFGETPRQYTAQELDWLSHKKVCIIYDNDTTGRNGSQALAKSIFFTIKTKGIYITNTASFGVQGGGDLDDFFQSGGTREKFFEIIKNNNSKFDIDSTKRDLPDREISFDTKKDYGIAEQNLKDLWSCGLLSGSKKTQFISAIAADELKDYQKINDKVKELNSILLEMESDAQAKAISDFIKENNVVLNAGSVPSEPYFYDRVDGTYKALYDNDYRELKVIAGTIFDKTKSHSCKMSEEVKIRSAIFDKIMLDVSNRESKYFNKQKMILVFNNLIYEFGEKPRGIIKDELRDLYLTEKIRIDFEPDSYKSEYILPGLEETVRDKDNLKIIQQFSGIFLFKAFTQKILWIKGEGGDGKSFFLNVLQHILGSLVSNFSLEALTTSHFAVSELFGKTLNIAQEIDAKEKTRDAALKLLSGDDYISADRKWKTSIKFKNEAMLLFAGNNDPVFLDTSRGLSRRPVFIEFNEIPLDKQKSNFFEDNVKDNDKELSAFINWAIDGYKDYLVNGLRHSDKAEETKKETRRSSDAVSDFWADILDRKEVDIDDLKEYKFIEKIHEYILIDHVIFYGTLFRKWAHDSQRGERISQNLFTKNTVRFMELHFRSKKYNISCQVSPTIRFPNDTNSNFFVDSFREEMKNNEQYKRLVFNYDPSNPRRGVEITGPDANKLYQDFYNKDDIPF